MSRPRPLGSSSWPRSAPIKLRRVRTVQLLLPVPDDTVRPDGLGDVTDELRLAKSKGLWGRRGLPSGLDGCRGGGIVLGREADVVGLVGRPGDAIGLGDRPGDEGIGWGGRLADVTGLDMGTLLGIVGLVGRLADIAGPDMGTLLGIVGLVGPPADAAGFDTGTLLGIVGLDGPPVDAAGFDTGTLLGIVGLDGRPMPKDKFGLGDVGRGDTGRTDMAGRGLWGSGGDAVGGLVGMRSPTGGCLLEGIAALGRMGGLAGGLAKACDMRGDLSSSGSGISRAPWGCRTWGMPGT